MGTPNTLRKINDGSYFYLFSLKANQLLFIMLNKFYKAYQKCLIICSLKTSRKFILIENLNL